VLSHACVEMQLPTTLGNSNAHTHTRPHTNSASFHPDAPFTATRTHHLPPQLMRALTDPEMVAVMLGDVKISTPGLHAAKGAAKKAKAKAKAKGK
jgi:hypothetical protein